MDDGEIAQDANLDVFRLEILIVTGTAVCLESGAVDQRLVGIGAVESPARISAKRLTSDSARMHIVAVERGQFQNVIVHCFSSTVSFPRHSRSEATKQSSLSLILDCFASLAMTASTHQSSKHRRRHETAEFALDQFGTLSVCGLPARGDDLHADGTRRAKSRSDRVDGKPAARDPRPRQLIGINVVLGRRS